MYFLRKGLLFLSKYVSLLAETFFKMCVGLREASGRWRIALLLVCGV
jgi:hypothetical protein